ncbi:hypothetical protein HPB49_021721 [Dermacentor silvarum]|uniref:Uncharacterized protein n=1 Tax=Dermacentor silvarum TaxID=543639 RepID=A0ACB8CHA0_DERSI|nr:hypothetical protein HPB49_021721 [Dermacentor silvarum]
MARPNVYVTRPDIPQEAMAKLKQHCNVTHWDKEEPVNYDVLLANVKGKDALLCMLTDKIDKNVIAAEVSGLTRGVPCGCAARASTARQVGFIGMGRIAQSVLRGMKGLHIGKAIYYDKFHPIKPAEEMGATYCSVDEIAAQSDFIVTLTNLTDETRGMYNKSFFSKMKKTAVFINTSRGGVVNQDDLYEALKNGTIRAAAIDVSVPEPLPKTDKLLTLRNLIVTPHIGSSEVSVRIQMGFLAVDNVINVTTGQPPRTKAVNL